MVGVHHQLALAGDAPRAPLQYAALLVAELSELLPLEARVPRSVQLEDEPPSLRPGVGARWASSGWLPPKAEPCAATSEVYEDPVSTSLVLQAIMASLERLEEGLAPAPVGMSSRPPMSFLTDSRSTTPRLSVGGKIGAQRDEDLQTGQLQQSVSSGTSPPEVVPSLGHYLPDSEKSSYLAEPDTKMFDSYKLGDGLFRNQVQSQQANFDDTCPTTRAESSSAIRAGVTDAQDVVQQFNKKGVSRENDARHNSFGLAGAMEILTETLTETDIGRRLAASMEGANCVRNEKVVAANATLARKAQEFVQSQYFDILCGTMILLNTMLIGVETEHLTKHDTTTDELRFMQSVLNLWFIVEFSVRLFGSGISFFIGPDRAWNMFDACLVATSVLDLVAESVEIGGFEIGRVIRALRLARVMRTLRIVRVLRYLRDFRKMVYAMVASMKTLLWSMLLLLFVIYTFAIWLTQGVTEFTRSRGDTDPLIEGLDEYYGSLLTSIYTLYKSITTGNSWGDAAAPLLEFSAAYTAVFIVFISISIFGVLNIVTSVFVESAMHSAQHSRELMVQDRLKDKEVYLKHLKTIFTAIDSDSSGLINEQELMEFLNNDSSEVQTYMEALELDGSDAHALFTLLDDDNSGCIDFTEFCTGCLQLRGEATAFDVHCLRYDTQRIQMHLNHFMSHVEDRLELIARAVGVRHSASSASVVTAANVEASIIDSAIDHLLEVQGDNRTHALIPTKSRERGYRHVQRMP